MLIAAPRLRAHGRGVRVTTSSSPFPARGKRSGLDRESRTIVRFPHGRHLGGMAWDAAYGSGTRSRLPSGKRRMNAVVATRRASVAPASLRITVAAISFSFSSLSPTANKKLKKTTRNGLQNSVKIIYTVEGRSYPPVYRAHRWAKGGWTYLRPSSFGI